MAMSVVTRFALRFVPMIVMAALVDRDEFRLAIFPSRQIGSYKCVC